MRHPGTEATRAARLPADEPATAAVPDLTAWLGRSGRVVTSPAARCRVPAAETDPDLGPWDLGGWTGLTLEQVPDLAAWRSDPSWCGHGGESLLALQQRVSGLLDRWHARPGRWAAVTHAAVIRAAVLHVVRAAPDAFWNIDVAPASLTELHPTSAGWRVVRVNCRAG